MKNETDALKKEILELQQKRARELRLLRAQFHSTSESFKPINLIKSTYKEISFSSELKSDVLSNAIGIGTGILSKKLLVGRSRNPIKNLFGTLLQFAIANSVSKHVGGVKSSIKNLVHYYLNRKKETKKTFQDKGHNGHNGELKESNNIKKVFQT